MLKDSNHAFHKAFCVFAIHQLRISAVTVWKRKNQIFAIMASAVFIELCGTEICLSFAGMMDKR